MIILALDTCFDACSAAVLDPDRADSYARFEPMKTGHAERIVPMIEEVMAEAGKDFSQIDRLAVTVGPGTFTGTRICVAAARSLALALERPLFGETSLAVMAEALARSEPSLLDGVAATLIATDARRGEFYCQVFTGNPPIAGEPPRVCTSSEAARLIKNCGKVAMAGSGAEAVLAAAPDLGGAVKIVQPGLLPNALALAHRVSRQSASAPPAAPLYLRPADAKPQSGKSIPRAIA